jgi:hypothetical protein
MLGGTTANRSSHLRSGAGEVYLEWPVPHGTAPILGAMPEPSDIDPGPGIIGIDR